MIRLDRDAAAAKKPTYALHQSYLSTYDKTCLLSSEVHSSNSYIVQALEQELKWLLQPNQIALSYISVWVCKHYCRGDNNEILIDYWLILITLLTG